MKDNMNNNMDLEENNNMDLKKNMEECEKSCEMRDPSIVSVTKAIEVFLVAAPLAVGAYHGYMNSHGIPIGKNLEWTLNYAPAIVYGGLGGGLGAVGGVVLGGGNFAYSGFEFIARCVEGAAKLGSVGALAGATIGGLETVIGYGIGYTVGSIMK